MPKIISKNLSPEELDIIQEKLSDWLNASDKRQIAKAAAIKNPNYINLVLNGSRNNDKVFNMAVNLMNRKIKEHNSEVEKLKSA